MSSSSVFVLPIGPFPPVFSGGTAKRWSFLAIGPSCLSFQLGRFEGVVSTSGAALGSYCLKLVVSFKLFKYADLF